MEHSGGLLSLQILFFLLFSLSGKCLKILSLILSRKMSDNAWLFDGIQMNLGIGPATQVFLTIEA